MFKNLLVYCLPNKFSICSQIYRSGIRRPWPVSVADPNPHWFNADPDTDPDIAFFLIRNPGTYTDAVKVSNWIYHLQAVPRPCISPSSSTIIPSLRPSPSKNVVKIAPLAAVSREQLQSSCCCPPPGSLPSRDRAGACWNKDCNTNYFVNSQTKNRPGIRCLFDPWIRDPEWVCSVSRIPDPKTIFWRALTIIWVKCSIILWKLSHIFFFIISKLK
jgi:hypothetical protein